MLTKSQFTYPVNLKQEQKNTHFKQILKPQKPRQKFLCSFSETWENGNHLPHTRTVKLLNVVNVKLLDLTNLSALLLSVYWCT